MLEQCVEYFLNACTAFEHHSVLDMRYNGVLGLDKSWEAALCLTK